VTEVFLYCLAVAAERTGVLIHAVVTMSDHIHIVVTDPQGRVPEFCGWLHGHVARRLNARYGRKESFWSSTPTSYVRLEQPDDVLAKVVYTAANPVAAGLVSHGRQWPGVRMYRPGRFVIRRPAGFFRDKGPTPEVAELVIAPAPIDAVSDTVGLATIERCIAAREAEVRAAFRQQDRRFLGARRVVAQRHTDTALTTERGGALSPRLACRDRWRRIEAIQRCKDFLAAHEDARQQWCAGNRDVVFPAGTYLMVRLHRAKTAATGSVPIAVS
jgi:REP element-mobilizing transposase RayT